MKDDSATNSVSTRGHSHITTWRDDIGVRVAVAGCQALWSVSMLCAGHTTYRLDPCQDHINQGREINPSHRRSQTDSGALIATPGCSHHAATPRGGRRPIPPLHHGSE